LDERDTDTILREQLARAEDELRITLDERKDIDARRAELTATAKRLRATVRRYKIALGIPARATQESTE
jgi:hypothetical protein